MSDKGTDFPQYRKLSNDKVFYRIVNEREFHEIQIIGNSAQLHKIIAKQYPEILKIQDLISLSEAGFIESNELEFENLIRFFSLQ